MSFSPVMLLSWHKLRRECQNVLNQPGGGHHSVASTGELRMQSVLDNARRAWWHRRRADPMNA